MKNLLIFLFGAAFGAGGTILWLRKDIQKELENIKNNSEVPFSVNEEEIKNEHDQKNTENESEPMAVKNETKVAYDKIVQGNYSTPTPVPVMPRNDILEEADDDPEAGFVPEDETDGGIFEIDRDTFDHDNSNEKKRLVYFRGDNVMATEAGTVIPNPYYLVGGNWETCVGNYTQHTAFIRNSKLVTDYEIFVEECMYEEEYGPIT